MHMKQRLVKAIEETSGTNLALAALSAALFYMAFGVLIMVKSHQAGNFLAFLIGLLTALIPLALAALAGMFIRRAGTPEKGIPDPRTPKQQPQLNP